AGRGTDTFPEARARYLPLTTARGAVGVLSVRPPSGGSRLTPDQRQQLEAFASLSALAIERARLADAALRADLLEATERLQSALLNSISHDLRTPLASITGALSSLRDKEVSLDEATRNELIDNSWLEAERLNHFVGNLLDMTRLESGAVHLRMEPCDIQELIGAALGRFSAQLRDRPLDVKVGEDLPLVPMDFVLITQVLVNLLDNALKYSSPGTPITVCAEAGNDQVAIEVSDRGTGIPPADLARVFDKFFRVQRSGTVAGTGLGLAIARGIVEAHGGTIAASNRIGGGTTVLFALPLDPASPAMSQEAP
ncbi:MAG TPA: ATP-binding protein, partial [Anaerolineae bacterium]